MSNPEIYLYSSRFCPYCIMAKRLLDSKAVSYRELLVDGKPKLRQEMERKSGRHTVPQIWIGDTHVGGCDDLVALDNSGRLDSLLAS